MLPFLRKRRPADALSRLLDGAGVPTLRQALPHIAAELERARRYGRPFTVMILSVGICDRSAELPPDSGLTDAPQSSIFSPMLASFLREALRGCDLVTYASIDARCVVSLPEVDAAGARLTIHRLRTLCSARLAARLRVGAATFPDHALTLDDLLDWADSAWSKESDMRASALEERAS